MMCSQSVGSSSTFNEVNIDFRISGLPNSVVKQVESSRVRELVKMIENRPHRQDFQADLHNNAYNSSSEKSKKMIQDMGNREQFEFFETIPKTQCKESLRYWNQGIVCCTCAHLLKEYEANRSAIQCTLDLLSSQYYVFFKKRRLHGHRNGNTYRTKRPSFCP